MICLLSDYFKSGVAQLSQTTGVLVFVLLLSSCVNSDVFVPLDFVDISDIVPNIYPQIQLDVRYYSDNNFVGKKIDGYEAEKVYLNRRAAVALRSVQIELSEMGLGLKVFDGYRPQRAVDHFVRWAKDLNDQKMKASFYPHVEKENLFRDGYIAELSGHSRGSTVDLTLVDLATGNEIDMGSPYDFFDLSPWPSSNEVSDEQKLNRARLRAFMQRHGFYPLEQEWWHFTLENESHPATFFDFIIQ